MTNPYEVEEGSLGINDQAVISTDMDQTENQGNIALVDRLPTVEETLGIENVPENTNDPELEGSNEIAPQDTREQRQQMWAEMDQWRQLPDGPDKDRARNAWTMKYYGMTYDEHQKQKQKRAFIYGGGKESAADFYSLGGTFGQRMSAAGTGLLDTTVDFLNLVPGINLPKPNKYQDDLAEATRNISALVIPMLMLEGLVVKGGTALHQAKVAPKWMQALGNNKLFSRLSAGGIGSGAEIGSGILIDSVAEQNKYNDTLATMWKENQWAFHSFIPDSWSTDGASPDVKARQNAFEGARLSFGAGILKSFAKLFKSSRSIDKVVKYTARSGYDNNALQKAITDEFDNIKYSDNVVEDEILRSEARFENELDKLADFFDATKESPSKIELGVHDIDDVSSTGIIVRNPDGVIGASTDAARIAANKGTTVGRLGTTISEAARKYGLKTTSLDNDSIVKGLADEIRSAGKFDTSGNVKLSWEEIDNAGTRLAEILNDPTLEPGDFKRLINEFKELDGSIKKVDNVGINAVNKALKKYMTDFLDMDVQKARAYLVHSEAGAASDLAEAYRLMDGTSAVERVQEQILDRLELLMVEKGIAKAQFAIKDQALESLKAAALGNNTKRAVKQAKLLNSNLSQEISNIIPSAKNWRKTIENLAEENPNFVKPLMLAYEFSDGNINSMYGLNKLVQNQLGTLNKFIYDGTPEIPSIINKAWWANYFNSVLSAFSTPVKALAGNFGGFISEPVSVLYGAMREGDLQGLRRASYQYFGLTDTLHQGWKHLGHVFRKVGTDPDSVSYIVRDDIALQKYNQSIEVTRAWADAAAEDGEFGGQALLSIFDDLDALSRDPILRFGANSMTALDGFTRMTQKVAEDKGKMFDLLMKKYPDGNWGKKEFREGWKSLHKMGFDENGMITSESVDYASREIALNLDSQLVRATNSMIKHFPIMRSVLLFPKTQMNVLDIFGKYGPTSRMGAGQVFAGDYYELLGPLGNKKIEEFVPEEIQEILSKRGIDMSGDIYAKLKALRYKIRGRVAIGNLAVVSALTMFTQGRIRGNGHWDPQVQRGRVDQGYKKKTFQDLNGNWHSYEWLGPVGDWLALTVDGLDNFNSMSSARFEHFEKKMAFVAAATFSNRTLLANLEPLGDIFASNGAAGARWAATFGNNMLPLGAQRNELGKIMYGMLREVDNDVSDLIRNRNNFLDAIDQEGALSPKYDWVSGTPVKQTEGESFWTRARNQYTPFKVYPNQSPEQQFLIDIEYDSRPIFNISRYGAKYTSDERSELGSLIGQDKYFNRGLKSIMRRAARYTWTDPDTKKTFKGYRNILNHVRNNKGWTTKQLPDNLYGINKSIDRLLRQSVNRIENKISTIQSIRQRETEKNLTKLNTEYGNLDNIFNLTQPSNSN